MKKLLLLILLFPLLVTAQTFKISDLKDGDLIFMDMDCGPLCDAIEAVTEGYKGNDFSHMGMVYRRNDSLYIVEAAGNSVRLTAWEKFRNYTKKPLYAGRLKPKYAGLPPKAVAFSLKQMGKPYDDEYVYNNGAYYCSELIYDAFLFANDGKPFFTLEPMTYRQPGTKEFFPAWVDYYKTLGKPIPQGLPGCNPGGISKSNKIDIIGTLQ